jgi:hypothetical protein
VNQLPLNGLVYFLINDYTINIQENQ